VLRGMHLYAEKRAAGRLPWAAAAVPARKGRKAPATARPHDRGAAEEVPNGDSPCAAHACGQSPGPTAGARRGACVLPMLVPVRRCGCAAPGQAACLQGQPSLLQQSAARCLAELLRGCGDVGRSRVRP
jgi:hypothetical protein